MNLQLSSRHALSLAALTFFSEPSLPPVNAAEAPFNLRTNSLTANTPQTNIPSASEVKDALNWVTQGAKNEIFATLVAIAVLGSVGRLGYLLAVRRLENGQDLEDVVVQAHRVIDGTLCFRGLDHDILSQVLANKHLQELLMKWASQTSYDNPIIPMHPKFRDDILIRISGSVSGMAFNSPHPLERWHLFVTCETDHPDAVTRSVPWNKIRIWLITPEELKQFSDWDYVKNIKVTTPHHSFRLFSLHRIACMVYHGEEPQNEAFRPLLSRTVDLGIRPAAEWTPINAPIVGASVDWKNPKNSFYIEKLGLSGELEQ
jgi:hypothetical protein